MRKWIKSLLLLVALVLVSILALIYGGFHLFKGVPAWYRHSVASRADREILARQAFNKFAVIQNAAALARRDENAAANPAPSASISVSFSDDELNAFFEKWASYADWKSNYERYVEDPIVTIQDDHLIFAGEVNDLGAVVSLQLDPQIDSNGKLDVRLDRILAGRLALPEMFVETYKERLADRLKRGLPEWRQKAAIDADGAANSDLISASMARLCIHALNHTAADPVLFLPLVERHANVPVRIYAVKVEDHTITMRVIPLDEVERAALVKRVQAEE